MTVPLLAQALVEKGVLDGAVLGFERLVDDAGSMVREYPWVALAVVVVALFLFKRRR